MAFRNMKEATYLFFVHFFVLDLKPLLKSFSLLFLLLLFGGSLLLGLFAGEGGATWTRIVVKVVHGIAKRRRAEGNKVLVTEKGKRGMKRCEKSGREQ